MVDAKATSRWYLVVTMGRKVGHLALGIGKAAGAALTLIPEEFKSTIRLKEVVDTLLGAMIKRMSYGLPHGVAVLAEGLVESIDPQDLEDVAGAERDAHGHLRLAEINFGEVVKARAVAGAQALRHRHHRGRQEHRLRAALRRPHPPRHGVHPRPRLLRRPVPDRGGSGVVVSIEGDHFKPLPFAENIDPDTGKTRVRTVDLGSDRYRIARRYMIRLNRNDFEDLHQIAKLAATCGITLDEFRQEFQYLVANEPPPIVLLEPPKPPRPEPAPAEPPAEPTERRRPGRGPRSAQPG